MISIQISAKFFERKVTTFASRHQVKSTVATPRFPWPLLTNCISSPQITTLRVTCSGAVTVLENGSKLSQVRKADMPSLDIVPQIEGYQAKSPLCRFYALCPKNKKTVF